jgi:hypothetical protein
MANEISTSRQIQEALKEFGDKDKIPVRLARHFQTNHEHVAGNMPQNELPKWLIQIDGNFSLVLQSNKFPDHLVGDLITLAGLLRNKLNEMRK